MSELSILLAKTLIPTICIEETVALFWCERSIRLAVVVLAMNALTNPAINVIIQTAPDAFFATDARSYAFVAVLEVCVWVIETSILKQWGGVSTLSRAAAMSLIFNGASYLSGFPLEALGWFD